MFKFWKTEETEAASDLEEAITNHINAFAGMDEGSEEQLRHAQALKTLMEARKIEDEIENDPTWRPSPDAVIAAGASILGILAILSFEKLNVVTSKALGFVPKVKI